MSSSIGTTIGGSLLMRGSPSTISVSLANALRLSFVRALATLRSNCLTSFFVACPRNCWIVSSTSRRTYQRSRFGIAAKLRHPLPIRLHDHAVDRLTVGLIEAAVSPCDLEARDEALHVPLERARQRLVEVVDAEHQPPVGRGEHPEVGEVRVTAELHVETGARHPCEIGGHEVGPSPVEGEGRDEHAPVADRDELGHPRLRLLLEQIDGRASLCRRLPRGMRGARDLGARRLAPRRALGRREMLDPTRASRTYLVHLGIRWSDVGSHGETPLSATAPVAASPVSWVGRDESNLAVR